MPSSAIRRATSADLDGVFGLTLDFATSFEPRIDAFEVSFRHLITQDDALLLVVEEADRLLGYLLGLDHYALYANGRVSSVEEVTVRNDRRGERHGRALIQHFELWKRSRGSRLVTVATRRAAGFYRSLGYEESAACFRTLL